MQTWQDQNVEPCVPSLWGYEIVSTLRKAVAVNWMSEEEASTALEHLLFLGIREIPSTEMLQVKAPKWAGKLGQTVAYDGAYVALAEHPGAELWTAGPEAGPGCSQAGTVLGSSAGIA